MFAAVSVLVAIACFGARRRERRDAGRARVRARGERQPGRRAAGALAGLGYCRRGCARGWRRAAPRFPRAFLARSRWSRCAGTATRRSRCSSPWRTSSGARGAELTSGSPSRGARARRNPRRRLPSLIRWRRGRAPPGPSRAAAERAADAERRAAAKAEKESRKQRLREEAREREAAEDADRRELQTLVENARAAKVEEETRALAERARAEAEAEALAEAEKAEAEKAEARRDAEEGLENAAERGASRGPKEETRRATSVPAPLQRGRKEAPGGGSAPSRDGRGPASVKTIPQPRAAPVPAPRLAAHKTLTAKKPADPKLVPAPRNPVPTPKKETEVLKKTPGPAPAAGPGLGKTPPSLGASTRVPPASGSGNADANITSNTLAVDFDPPLPPMAPMAPAPAAWAGPPPAAPVAPAPGLSPGESPTASAPAEARDAFDPLGAGSRLGAGAGFVHLLREPARRARARASRFRARARRPSPSAPARADRARLRTAPPGAPPPLSPGAPPPPPSAPPPLPSGPPPRRRASPGGGTRRLPRRRPPLPPMPHPARAQSAFGGGIFGGFSSARVSRLSSAAAGGTPFGAFRRSASEPHHERFDSDEFRAEGRELEDELMALTGGLMHLDDDDDEISPAPKPEEEARVATTTTDRGSVFARTRGDPRTTAVRERRRQNASSKQTRA